jgi:hypothetical protein
MQMILSLGIAVLMVFSHREAITGKRCSLL